MRIRPDLAFATVVTVAVISLTVWLTATAGEPTPNPETYRYHCATDGECYGEELAVFGTIDGQSPLDWPGTPSLTAADILAYARYFRAHGTYDDIDGLHAPGHAHPRLAQ